MTPHLIALTGFGAFEGIEENPSAGVARALAQEPPAGLEVRSAVLPVSFRRAPRALDELLQELEPRVPDLLVALGVWSGGSGYRLELRARGRLETDDRPDMDGEVARATTLDAGEPLRTPLDLSGLPDALARAGVGDVRLSEDAGGYVCERIYHHLLTRAGALDRPALFVHVPPLEREPVERQTEVVGAILSRLTS